MFFFINSPTFSATDTLLTFHMNSKIPIKIDIPNPQANTKNTPPTLSIPSSGVSLAPSLPSSQLVTIKIKISYTYSRIRCQNNVRKKTPCKDLMEGIEWNEF